VFNAWYKAIGELADGVIAISRTVSGEFKAWLCDERPPRVGPLQLGWFHLGADLMPARHADPVAVAATLPSLGGRPTFLMVGTIEPRKGHAQALAAIEQLWARGRDINLVIIGKPGWRVEKLMERFRSHPEAGRRLFWMERANDDQLVAMYGEASALIAASEAEGFGLPLIEAAQYGLSIIARDIPVFREVAGGHAVYFGGRTPESMAEAVATWLDREPSGGNPESAGMPWLTWAQATDQLVGVALGGKWYDEWLPGP
jgi:glycosyltransferase involved in cell wall biosynthesis